VIVAICADKGSPGVTTLTLALGLVWPGERLVLEADPAGADLAFRLRRRDRGAGLDPDPSVLSLAVDARAGLAPESLPSYAQPTTLGVAVIPGAPTAEDHQPMRDLWQRVAAEAAAWRGVVLTDLGRLQPGHPARSLAQAATVMLLLTRPALEGLYRMRHRVIELAQLLGSQEERLPIAVAVLAPPTQRRAAVDHVTRVVRAAGSSAMVAGCFAADPLGERALYGAEQRQLTRSPLVASASALAEALTDRWPELNGEQPQSSGVVA